MQPFISSDDLAAYLGETVDGEELLTQIALDASCQLVRDYLNQTVNLITDDLEVHDGHSHPYLQLREHPVIQVSTVIEDDEELVEGDDYVVDTRVGRIRRYSSALSEFGWFTGFQNILVTYDHGYAIEEAEVEGDDDSGDAPRIDRVPSSIRVVALELAAKLIRAPQLSAVAASGGVTSETIGNYSYTIETSVAERLTSVLAEGLNDTQRKSIERYRFVTV